MFFLDKYITGTGLNFTNLYNNKVSKVKNYSIQLIPKYNFVICEFEELQHTESELTNYAHSIKLGGYLIIRKKYTHEECYNEIYFYNDILDSLGLNLINYEVEDNYCCFIFKKVKKLKSLFVGAVVEDKEKLIKITHDIANSELAKNNYIALQVLSKEELWLDSEIFKKLPKFSSVSIFTQHHEKGFDNNKLLYNWNRLINVCKSKQILLINDNFNINNFYSHIPFTNEYLYITDINKIRKLNGIDFRYETIEWGVYDLCKRYNLNSKEPEFNENDNKRLKEKQNDELIDNSIRWVNIHEALGDNICAFNLLECIKSPKLEVATAYPFLYELSYDIKLRNSRHEINGLGFSSYEHGSELKCKSLEHAYFSMLGEADLYPPKKKKIFYNTDAVNRLKEEYKNKKIVLLAPSASNREGPGNGLMKSNKTWDFERWKLVVTHLQNKGYYVIQVGVKEDFTVDNVNEFFFNRSFSDLVALITVSKFFMGLDTFFQHLCGLMGKKGIVVTPAHNDHAFWPSATYIVGKVNENFEHLKWIKDHLNPYRAPCMKSITVESVIQEADKLIECFDKY